jgi:CHASE3 domain sensor protein
MNRVRAWFGDLPLTKKMAWGFGSVTLILAFCVGATLWKVNQVKAIYHNIFDKRVPTAEASERLLLGLENSLANLTAYFLNGDSHYERLRTEEDWENGIDVTLAELERLSQQWVVQMHLDILERTQGRLVRMRDVQQQAADISTKAENNPAVLILKHKIVPKNKILGEDINSLIANLSRAERSQAHYRTLSYLAAFTLNMGFAETELEAFLLSGDSMHRERFNEFWKKKKTDLDNLAAMKSSLSRSMVTEISSIETIVQELEPITAEIFDIGQENWNVAQSQYRKDIIPLSEAIFKDLKLLIEDHRRLRDKAYMPATVCAVTFPKSCSHVACGHHRRAPLATSWPMTVSRSSTIRRGKGPARPGDGCNRAGCASRMDTRGSP